MSTPTQTDLWQHLHDEHGLILLESEQDEIVRLATVVQQAEIDDLRAQLARTQAERDEQIEQRNLHRQDGYALDFTLQHVTTERDEARAALARIKAEVDQYADGAPDATAHDRLANTILGMCPADALIDQP